MSAEGPAAPDDGGPSAPLFTYQPARFGPMTVALLFILVLTTPFALGERLVAGRLDQAAVAALPLALTLLFGWLTSPSPLEITRQGIAVSRPRGARLRGDRGPYAWEDVVNVYPTFYEDSGMRFSPFAAAEGTAKHAGIRIEAKGGEKLVVPFTPTVLNLRRHGTPPYHAALEAVRQACAGAGRPLVQEPPNLSTAQVEEMLVEASKPLLPFPVTVAGIFAPALLIPGLAVLWGRAAGAVPPEGTAIVVAVGLLPLAAVFLLVNLRSGRRTHLLHEVQKHRAAERERGPAEGAGGAPANGDTPQPPARVLRARGG